MTAQPGKERQQRHVGHREPSGEARGPRSGSGGAWDKDDRRAPSLGAPLFSSFPTCRPALTPPRKPGVLAGPPRPWGRTRRPSDILPAWLVWPPHSEQGTRGHRLFHTHGVSKNKGLIGHLFRNRAEPVPEQR